MLVKIIALGHTPAIWKNVFHHLRTQLPSHPFSAGIFCSGEEINFLSQGYLPHHWPRERPDFFMCEPPTGAAWQQRLALIERARQQANSTPLGFALVLRTVEFGLKQLIQGPMRVELHLDNGATYQVDDPGLVIGEFPAKFPRLRVNAHFSALRTQDGAEPGRELKAEDVPSGTVLGFGQLAAMRQGEESLDPEEWLRRTLAAEKLRLPRGSEAMGLICEQKNWFLFPGIPAGRVAGVTLNGLHFEHLIDLGQMGEDAPYFPKLREAVRRSGESNRGVWAEHTQRIRLAELKNDLPVVCGGGPPLVRETLAALLGEQGFRHCSTLAAPTEGIFRDPALLLQLGPWEGEAILQQVETPQLWPLEAELAPPLAPLDSLAPWQELSYSALASETPALTPPLLMEQLERLAAREKKASEGLDMTGKRILLLTQELAVQQQALEKLAGLLQAEDTVQIWSGSLPPEVKQVLVFSHDQEEAGAVLQALPGISRKRWFDLGPYTDSDSLPGLSLESVRHYLDGGVMVITASSRERLRLLHQQVAGSEALTAAELQECGQTVTFYQEELEKLAAGKRELARRWVRDSLAKWLQDNHGRLVDQLEALRGRHERKWFSRALVNRVIMIPSSGANHTPLLGACGTVYPGFSAGPSVVVHYDYEPLESLPPEHRAAALGAGTGGTEEMPSVEQQSERLQAALERLNAANFEDYLRVITLELEEKRADLLIIEHRREVCVPVLEHIRRNLPALAHTPVILIFPEAWSPGEHEALPWPHSRVVLLPRMGTLNAEECARHLRALYSA